MKRKIAITLCALCSTMVFSACGSKKTEENNQIDATTIELDTEVTGTVEDEECAWYVFQTGKTEDAAYDITFENYTDEDAGNLNAYLFDEDGAELENGNASPDEGPETISTNQLDAGATYYIRLESDEQNEVDYSLVVKNSEDSDADENQENQEDSNGPEKEVKDSIVPGPTMEEAMLLPLGVKVFGTANPDAWFAFTTGEAGTTYNLTFVNASAGNLQSQSLVASVYDASGTEIEHKLSDYSGAPMTLTTNELEANTLYYIRINSYTGTSSLDFSVIIKDPNDKTTAYKTAGNFSKARGGSILEDGTVIAGMCQSTATLLPFGVKASGTINDSSVAWFGFTTGETENATYNITFSTPTEKSGRHIEARLYDEYGTKLASGLAHDSGTLEKLSTNKLEVNTTYYICILPGDPSSIDYSLFVESSEPEKDDTLVFEVPFEINETQVKFVINSDEFIDKAKAKEALKPVADAILEHPDNSILIAGTTATDGTQASCVDLANRRANAVKKLLMDTYGVPKKQLKTIGLGYERDPFERGKDRDSNGKFVESEGKKNRRVVILDIEDPIAQEILKNNK